jgi:hypothetical protein
MLTGALTAQTVRDTYLRGIDLGQAWTGPSADAALMQLVFAQLAHAEALMSIHFQRWRVVTAPDPTAVPGTDFDVLDQMIPYVRPTPDQTDYALKVMHHDVHAVTRLRLWQGGTTYLPVPLPGLRFSVREERLHVPLTAVPDMDVAQGWAVDYLMGMGQLPSEVVEWCAIGAAIQVLSLGAVAADVSHGLAAESLRQDGIDEKITYGGFREAGGMYAGPIAILRDRRADLDLSALRFRYQNTLGDRWSVPADAVIPTLP